MKKRIKWNPRFITSLFIAFMCTLNCLAQNVIKGSVNDGSGEKVPPKGADEGNAEGL